MATRTFRFAGLQLLVGTDKEANLAHARRLIARATTEGGARLVSLPECFNCPYSNDSFPVYAESIPDGPSTRMLQEAAREHSIYVVGGSMPEREGDRLYNTSVVCDPQGNIIAKHRKIHLFDVCVPPGEGRPGITFRESDTLSSGNSLTSFQTEWCEVGLGICYDIRFPEMAQLLARKGAKLLMYPGAFNTTTGPAHWELLQRARAVDNQVYVATVSPARNPESTYQAWGHSTVVDPWGTVVATTEHDEAIVYADINLDKVDEVRNMLQLSKQKRHDLYHLNEIHQ